MCLGNQNERVPKTEQILFWASSWSDLRPHPHSQRAIGIPVHMKLMQKGPAIIMAYQA